MSTVSRRNFLATATCAGAAVAASGGCGSLAPTSPSSGIRYGMVIDLQKCVGCKACSVACKAENHTPPGVSYMVVLEEEIGRYPHVQRRFIPRPCMQCSHSSCTSVCPTGATYERDDGVVAIDYEKCIGCRYCMTACPYGARSFDCGHNYHTPSLDGPASNEKTFVAAEPTPYDKTPSPEYGENRDRKEGASPIGNVRKCHFCLHRVNKGMLPACASSCIGRAIHFGDLNDPNSIVYKIGEGRDAMFPNFPGRHVMQLKEETGNDPSVYYLT